MVSENHPFSVTELASRLNIPVNSVFRILKELENRKYLEKDHTNSTYTLTGKLYYMGNVIGSRISLKAAAQHYLRKFWEHTNETVILTVFGSDYSTLIFDQLISTEPIKFVSTIGIEFSSYSSAMGKAMLAFLPPEELKQYLQNVEMKPVTPYTITSPVLLAKELEEVQKKDMRLIWKNLLLV